VKRDLRSQRRNIKQRRNVNQEEKGESARVTKLLVLFILATVVISFLFNLFIHTTKNTVITEYGKLTKAFRAKGLFVREEDVRIAPMSGYLKLNVAEGEKVNNSTLVAKVKNTNKIYDLCSRDSGLVSYNIDGLESVLSPDELDQLTYQRFQQLKYKRHRVHNGEKLNSGRPVFKIVDNFLLYLVVPISKSKTEIFKTGLEVNFELINFAEKIFSARVDRIIESQPKNLLILRVKRFLPLFLKLRKVDVNLIRSSYNGIVIPNSALVKREDKVGVIIQNQNKTSFKEVKVLSNNAEKAIVRGIDLGIKILEEPENEMGD
jgi:putative membrane fusion protein